MDSCSYSCLCIFSALTFTPEALSALSSTRASSQRPSTAYASSRAVTEESRGNTCRFTKVCRFHDVTDPQRYRCVRASAERQGVGCRPWDTKRRSCGASKPGSSTTKTGNRNTIGKEDDSKRLATHPPHVPHVPEEVERAEGLLGGHARVHRHRGAHLRRSCRQKRKAPRARGKKKRGRFPEG